jgi:hypothetical protein
MQKEYFSKKDVLAHFEKSVVEINALPEMQEDKNIQSMIA